MVSQRLFQGVILDVDGTLVDSNDAHAHAFVEAFRDFGFDIAFERVRALIGKGSDKLIPELIGRYDEAIAERKKEIFKRKYLARLRPFPEVEKLLAALKARGFRLAVASSAGKDELEALLKVAGARPYLEDETNADDAEHSKPDPDIVQAAVRKLGLAAAQCVLIGDTPYDAQAAQRAGVAFIGVRCGGWGDRDLQPALAVYDDPADLLRHIDCWTTGIHYTESDMADDLKQTGKADDQRINVEQDHELSYWSKELGVSREELRAAVQRAGPMVEDVRRQLQK